MPKNPEGVECKVLGSRFRAGFGRKVRARLRVHLPCVVVHDGVKSLRSSYMGLSSHFGHPTRVASPDHSCPAQFREPVELRCVESGVWRLRFGGWRLRFRVQGAGFRFRVQGAGCRALGRCITENSLPTLFLSSYQNEFRSKRQISSMQNVYKN